MAGGITFVPLDCQLDEKFDYIEAEFGLIGFAVVVKLFQRIYGGHGYYCEWNDRVALLFAHKIGAGGDVVREIVSAAIREGIFSKEMLENFGVLTSRGIQKRFSDVAKRRKEIFDKPEYVLLDYEQNSDDVDISGENVCNSDENVCNPNTSKVKESKASKDKGSKESSAAPPPAPPPPKSPRELLAEKYGSAAVADYEQRYRNWQAKSGRTGGDMYAAIAKWMAQDGVTKPAGFESSFDVDEVMRRQIEKYRKRKAES